jgi:3-deoxy-D-manno-octulosonic-acid transferase
VSLVSSAASLTGTCAGPVLRGMLNRRVRQGKEIAARLAERRGVASVPRPDGKLIWIHAASVGETMSVLSLIDALAGRAQVLLTTGTVTSAKIAAERLPAHAFHQFVPLDVPAWVENFLRHWRPDAAVFVESEIWPNLLRLTDSHGIPRLLINASFSPRSAKRWQKLLPHAGILIYGFRYVHVQSRQDAETFHKFGNAGILEWGNLKYAAPLLPFDPEKLAALHEQIRGPTWLAASTHAGEEDIVIQAHQILLANFPTLVTIIAPRHPERGAEFSLARRSLGQPPVPAQVYIADTLGELGLFYRFAPFAFIGGSLVATGGHNLAEAARLKIPIITGPFTQNIGEQAQTLRACRALVQVRDAPSLAAAVTAWLQNPSAAAQAGEAAKTAFAGLESLPQKLADLILRTAL